MVRMKSAKVLAVSACLCLITAGLFAGGSAEEADRDLEIEIMWQQEVTEEFWTRVLPVYEQEQQTVPVEFNLAPQAYEQIRFRLTSGDAPDIFFTWASEFDFIGAIESGKLYPVDEVLSAPTDEGGQTLGDILFDAGLELGKVDDAHYLLPIGKLLASMYYDRAFFEEHGYDVPETMDDFLALGETLQTEHGIPAIIFAGAYPFMLSDALIWPMIANQNPDAVTALNNNEPGAWTAEPVVAVLAFVEEMADSGYISRDSVAMDHIQSQIEFINHNAAIVPSGSWLEGEMAGQWPEEFVLTPLAAPGKDGTKSMMAITEAMVLPRTETTDAKLSQLIRLIQLFYSEDISRQNMLSADYVMAFENVPADIMNQLPESVPATWEIASQEDVAMLSPEHRFRHKDIFIEYNNLINALVLGDVTAEEMAQQMEKLAEEYR
jgi:N-acetylglucosamine transport system substrate-binding protein